MDLKSIMKKSGIENMMKTGNSEFRNPTTKFKRSSESEIKT
jgi:hypothetical protein